MDCMFLTTPRHTDDSEYILTSASPDTVGGVSWKNMSTITCTISGKIPALASSHTTVSTML